MADITKTVCVTNGSVEFAPAAAAESQTIVVDKDTMCVYVKNGGATELTATVTKGNGIASAMGDLAIKIAAGKEAIIGPLESARFGNKGAITLTLSATASVTVGVIQL